MDIKKINIKPVDVSGKINELIDKIPESVSSLLKKIGIALFVIGCLGAMYNGYTEGFSSAKEEGMELARDTKTLFLEEIERNYNRKRKDVRAGGDLSNLLSSEDYKPQKSYLSYSRESDTREGNQRIIDSDSKPLEKEGAIQGMRGSGETPPLAEIYTNAGNLSPETSVNEPRRNYRPLKDEFSTTGSGSAPNFYGKNLRNTPNYNQSSDAKSEQKPYLDPTVLPGEPMENAEREKTNSRLLQSKKNKKSDSPLAPE